METIVTDLVGAVRRGEISAWFQPQIDLRDGRVVAAEALCRWNHPVRGMVPPPEFIAAAEESKLIEEIGVFMARQGCLAIERWRIDVSVNVSPLQLETAAFTNWLETQLSGVSTGSSTLTIEITEEQPMRNVPAVVRRLDRLRALGVGVAIDDFGVGQSSLKQLRRLHGTELKLDRSLIEDESAEALIARAVEAARAYGVRTVVEGIETTDQLELVTRLGCDRAQGYLLGRPMPREAMDELVAA
ncbi:EAL domain-containing protein [Leifsonia poae]|uniref:EAL domain-containing protein n=1 Tax=Leifsonia poae TaxID=110933 RepID=UPI003D69EA06